MLGEQLQKASCGVNAQKKIHTGFINQSPLLFLHSCFIANFILNWYPTNLHYMMTKWKHIQGPWKLITYQKLKSLSLFLIMLESTCGEMIWLDIVLIWMQTLSVGLDRWAYRDTSQWAVALMEPVEHPNILLVCLLGELDGQYTGFCRSFEFHTVSTHQKRVMHLLPWIQLLVKTVALCGSKTKNMLMCISDFAFLCNVNQWTSTQVFCVPPFCTCRE